MDISEFVGKMAEQHSHLLKVIELQNNSIQAIHQRLNALSMSQSILFSLLMDSNDTERERVANQLKHMLQNSSVNDNQYLLRQLEEWRELCEAPDVVETAVTPVTTKSTPEWFQGIVEGGLSRDKT